jgi:predicted Mrr-cat superfamily restriction endonuclease
MRLQDMHGLIEHILQSWSELPDQPYWLQLSKDFRSAMRLKHIPFLIGRFSEDLQSHANEMEQEPEIAAVLMDEGLLARSKRLIASRVAMLSADQLANVVASILRMQGYRAECRTCDVPSCADVRAIRSNSAAYPPRLQVRVTTAKEKAGLNTLTHFCKGNDCQGADMKVIVFSASGFLEDARTYAWNKFFRLRLYDIDDITEQLIAYWQYLPKHIKEEIPLKWFWALANTPVDGEIANFDILASTKLVDSSWSRNPP